MKITEELWNKAASEFSDFKTDAWTIDHTNNDRTLLYYKSILRYITRKEVFVVFPGFLRTSEITKTDKEREKLEELRERACKLFGSTDFLNKHNLTPAFKCILPVLETKPIPSPPSPKKYNLLYEDEVVNTNTEIIDNKYSNGSSAIIKGAKSYITGPIFLFGDDLVILLSHSFGRFNLSIILFTGDSAEEVKDIYNDYNKAISGVFEETEEKQIYKINIGTISYSKLNFKSCNISLRYPVCPAEVYNEDFPETEIDEFIKNEEGGLGIFYGDPGCGKSTYIKHLAMKFPEKKFNILSQDIIFGYLSEVRNYLLTVDGGSGSSVYIIEDCEKLLVSRESKENISTSILSEILNMSDGIMGDYLNVKFILTFNTEIPNIDRALLRKGRLKIKYEFKPLSGERLKALAEKRGITLTPEERKKGMSLAEIFNHELRADFSEREKAKKIGF